MTILNTTPVNAGAADPRESEHIECDCVPNLGPSHCHLCGEIAGHEMPWTVAHPELVVVAEMCTSCAGAGGVGYEPCVDCMGTGEIPVVGLRN